MDPAAGPSSPRRRLMLRQGLAGTAAAFALLGGVGPARLVGLAPTPAAAAGSWATEKLAGDQFDRMERLAQDNRHFQIIRDYFAHEDGRDWPGRGRDAFRVRKNGVRVRDVFAQHFRNPDNTQWVSVIFGQEDDGQESSSGYLWRGEKRRFTDRYFVQNGNLRRENEDEIVRIAQIGGCEVDEGVCAAGTSLGCGAAGVAAVGVCGVSLGLLCVGTAGVATGCAGFFGDINDECVEFASGGEC